MGIVLDSVRMEARLPEDKLARIKMLLDSFKGRRSARLIELQSLIGTLQFACKVVVPGRTFLQRMINLTRGVPSRFHHVRLNKEFFRDVSMWRVFLTSWNGRSLFLDSFLTAAPDLELYTDAASTVGFGGYFNGKWFQGRWPQHLLINKLKGISIEWQELFPIVIACALWHPQFSGKRLQFWCDNESVVAIINSGSTFQGTRPPGRPDPLYHPAFADDPLRDEVLTYAHWALSRNTNRTYNSGEKRFIQFCLMNRLISPLGDILPASEGTLIYFASYLARTVRHSTVKLYLAAVRNLHIRSGFSDPVLERPLLKKVLRGILRYQGSPRTLRQPVTPRVLLSIRPVLQSRLSLRDFSMVWAAFTLAFFAFLRCSEFTYQGVRRFNSRFDLTTDCITFSPSLACPQRIVVLLKSSKTDVYRQGQSLSIARCSSLLCPVSAMQQYFLLAQPRPGPLFYFQSGSLLTRSSVTKLLRDSARSAGLSYRSLKGHSFRIGAASTAAAAGLPDWLIKVLGRWSSDCYQLYIRTPESVLLSAAPRMASISSNVFLG
ncbi:uncharacterized protein LOC144630064 [Oculina patagonica]